MGIDLVTSGTVLRTRRGGGKRQVDQLTASKPLSQGSCRGHSCIGGVPSGGQAAPRCLSAGAFQPLFLSSCGSLLCRCFPCFPPPPILVAPCNPLCLSDSVIMLPMLWSECSHFASGVSTPLLRADKFCKSVRTVLAHLSATCSGLLLSFASQGLVTDSHSATKVKHYIQ